MREYLAQARGTTTGTSPCVQTVPRIAGWGGGGGGGESGEILSFLWPTVHTRIDCPLSAGAIVAELVWDCATVTVRGTVMARTASSSSVPPHFAHAHIWSKQLCAINYEPKIALPSKFCPRTHQLSRGRQEISPRSSVQTVRLEEDPPSRGTSPATWGGGGGVVWTGGLSADSNWGPHDWESVVLSTEPQQFLIGTCTIKII